MTTSRLARCPSCRAIVNANWTACLACRKPLETTSAGQTAEAGHIAPGSRIEWLGEKGMRRGMVDFVQSEPDGSVWLFVSFPDETWAAVNRRYMTGLEVRPS